MTTTTIDIKINFAKIMETLLFEGRTDLALNIYNNKKKCICEKEYYEIFKNLCNGGKMNEAYWMHSIMSSHFNIAKNDDELFKNAIANKNIEQLLLFHLINPSKYVLNVSIAK
jgi:hypothetical protein